MEQSIGARLASGTVYLLTIAAIIAPILLWKGWVTPVLFLAAAAGASVLIALILRRSRFVLVHALHGLTLLLIVGLWWAFTGALLPGYSPKASALVWMIMLDLPGLICFFLLFCFRDAVQGSFFNWPLLTWYRRQLMPGQHS